MRLLPLRRLKTRVYATGISDMPVLPSKLPVENYVTDQAIVHCRL